MARSSTALAPARASNGSSDAKTVRCAIYTRKSTEEGLQQEFNSLDAQREASEAFVASQKHEGWQVITEHFDDGGFTGGNMDRPALKRLLAAVEARSVDCIVVYKVDRLSRSLLDFARIIEVFDRNAVSFVAVTQQFNTTSSLGRLTLNILLSFAQFERELIRERQREGIELVKRAGAYRGRKHSLSVERTAELKKRLSQGENKSSRAGVRSRPHNGLSLCEALRVEGRQDDLSWFSCTEGAGIGVHQVGLSCIGYGFDPVDFSFGLLA